MNSFLRYLALLGVAAVVGSSQVGAIITVTPSSISFPAGGGLEDGGLVRSFNASGSPIAWTVPSKPSWITVSPSSGNGDDNGVGISASSNDTGSSRSGTVVFRQSGTGTQDTVAVTQAAKLPQTITWSPVPPTSALTTQPVTLAATATSGLPVSFLVVSGPGSLSGNTLSFSGAGSVVVRASVSGNSTYTSAASERTITVSKVTPSITWSPPNNALANIPVTLSGTATSGLPVTFAVVSGSGSLNGNILSFSGDGQVVVQASVSGNAIYNATTSDRTIVVSKAIPVFTFSPPATALATDALVLTASSESPGAITFAAPSPGSIFGSILSFPGGISSDPTPVSVTATVAATPIYQARTLASEIVVSRAAQTITFIQPAGVSLANPEVTLSATASSGLPVGLTLVSGPATLVGNLLTVTGDGTVLVRASQAGNTFYRAAPDVEIAVSAYPRAVVFQTHEAGADVSENTLAIPGVPRLRVPPGVGIEIPRLMNDTDGWRARFRIGEGGFRYVAVWGGASTEVVLCNVYRDLNDNLKRDVEPVEEPILQENRPLTIMPFAPAETERASVTIGQPISAPPAPAGVSGGLFAREALRNNPSQALSGFVSADIAETGLQTVVDAGRLTSIIPELPGLGAREPWSDPKNFLRIGWRYAEVLPTLPPETGPIEWFGGNVSYEIAYDEGGDALVMVRDPARSGGGSPIRTPAGFGVAVYAWQPGSDTPLPGNSYEIDINGNLSLPAEGRLILVFDPTPTEPQSGDETYQTVVAVDHESGLTFDATVAETPIGEEIAPPAGTVFGTVEYGVVGSDAQTYPGHGHALQRDPNETGDLGLIYGAARRGGWSASQIIPVNEDRFEVWWHREYEIPDSGGLKVVYPSVTRRYHSQWPEIPVSGPAPDVTENDRTRPGKIVIASQNGSGPLVPESFKDPGIYYQNDPSKSGFNPNDEHALLVSPGAYALRNDFERADTSKPYVLLHYREPADADLNPRYRIKVMRVVAEDASQSWTFTYGGNAGVKVQPLYPLSTATLKPTAPQEIVIGRSGPFFEDRKGELWALAAGDDGVSTTTLVADWFYRNQSGFYYPTDVQSYAVGESVPFLDNNTGDPRDVNYIISWPLLALTPKLLMGETQLHDGEASVQVIYEQGRGLAGNGPKDNVMLIDYKRARKEGLSAYGGLLGPPADVVTEGNGSIKRFGNLPPALAGRLTYDSSANELRFEGKLMDSGGAPWVLLNVITEQERGVLLDAKFCGSNVNFKQALTKLCNTAAAVEEVPNGDYVIDPATALSFDSLALTAGFAQAEGFVTLAFGNDPDKSDPSATVALQVIRVAKPLYRGAVRVIEPESLFDEKLSLLFDGDLAGLAGGYRFEWKTVAASAFESVNPLDDASLPGGGVPWGDYASGIGRNGITIEGPGLATLADNYYTMHYTPLDPDHPCFGIWSQWTPPQLAEGWIKRVLAKLNPFNQRFSDLSDPTRQVDTRVSMISLAGPRWEGNIPFTEDGANNAGLIEAYETILRRGIGFSIEGLPAIDDRGANDALLLAAGRIADLYTLLGNEAYADAADPTLSVGSQFASSVGSIHAFMEMTGGSTLLEEELSLLRGRDDLTAPGVRNKPVYNRLLWNFSRGNGEVAYVNNYGIRDQVTVDPIFGGVTDPDHGDGRITEEDARIDYPQGHGDAWGHYLSAIKNYYRLLRNTNFTWKPRTETILLAGHPTEVNYLDERKFATAAALRAKTGSEIVSLTYRDTYKEDPALQWQGYKDPYTYPNGSGRAWGMDEWGVRAGQGAYLDWVMGNALLPAIDSEHSGIQKIDRSTVTELREVAANMIKIQSEVDKSNSGLNPLGLLKESLPLYELSPADIDAGRTLFEKAYEHAVTVLNNALAVFNRADGASQQLREQADTLENFQLNVDEKERDFQNRLIEIFGYPYNNDIGGTGTYPAGYNGPDIYHYMYIDPSELIGVGTQDLASKTENAEFIDYGIERDAASDRIDENGSLNGTPRIVKYNISTQGYGPIKPVAWFGSRLAQGQLQAAQSEVVQARASFEQAIMKYDNHLKLIEDRIELLEAQYKVNALEIAKLNSSNDEQIRLNAQIMICRKEQIRLRNEGRFASMLASAAAEALPLSGGTSTDFTSTIRSMIRLYGVNKDRLASEAADGASIAELTFQQAKEDAQAQTNVTLTTLRSEFGVLQEVAQIESLLRESAGLRLEAHNARERILQATERLMSLKEQGNRLLEERLAFRQNTAANVQSLRYKDLAFRITRNDALEKFRAQFDLAAVWVYQAARAYDFDTNWDVDSVHSTAIPGATFLESIVKSRAIGEISGGQPIVAQNGADGGLADPMARMKQNWDTVRGPLGYNQTQEETIAFSLRREMLRIPNSAPDGMPSKERAALNHGYDRLWRETLQGFVVPDVRKVPEIVRNCILPTGTNAEPAIVIPFATTVENRINFFGWPLAGGDSYYSPNVSANKIQRVGIWFSGYSNTNLTATPRVYLIPMGSDIMRSPGTSSIREWRVLEQVIPTPFALTENHVASLPASWVPSQDPYSFSGSEVQIRRFGDFLAWDGSSFDENELNQEDSRLVGRSVWNTRWLLIIRSGALLGGVPIDEGIQRFINGALLPGQPAGGTRDGYGVKDILLNFQTYTVRGY